MRKLLLPVIIVTGVSCSPGKAIVFTSADRTGKPVAYALSIPKGSKSVQFGNPHYKGTSFVYPDSSMIFFTDDVTHSQIYRGGRMIYPRDLRMKFITNDSLTIRGVDTAGGHWEERKRGSIIYGYWNVPPAKKPLFDSLLNRLKAVR
jgi:hypothetical protein